MRTEDSMELKDILADWRDYDDAAFRLGIFLGVFPPDQRFNLVKRMDEEDARYKWNPAPIDLS
ncbi:hypothetical protein [Streptomyces canus]|uniref:hypothetical protein n=1 Tax=Streptomyces canus TaxID=58343 RepID=UPI002DDA8991|nr:hypothetical protein [Streptomyces canus]WSD90406.1 hypothetical protein OG925_41515 [Streptomyces canus]